MADPQVYRWEYERSAWDSVPGATRFSVGIYQWLPKSSGKGLKKSNTIRVNGYVAEPQRVYDKADELCQRLNVEGVRADAPPDWVQKSYSLPKPPDVELGRFSDGLTGAQVRSVREKVMAEHLLPAGFISGDEPGTYVRLHGEQVHLINFQPSKYGGDFFVNVCFHFSFALPLFQQARVRLPQVQLLDCTLRARVGEFLSGQDDADMYKYGNDREDLSQRLVWCATKSLDVFNREAERWSDLTGLLLEPKRDALFPWHDDSLNTTRPCVLLRLGRYEEADALLRELAASDWEPDRREAVIIRAELDRVRRDGGYQPARDAWILD
jgi:hypothetical protein